MIETSLDDLLTSRAFLEDPYPTYRLLREKDPVHWSDAWGVWVLTRYDDTITILRDAAQFSSVGRFSALLDQLPPEVQQDVEPLRRHYSSGLIQSDPPDHERLRLLVRQAFTPRTIAGYRERVQSIVDRLLEPLAETGEIDIVRDFAFPLPVFVVSEMLGAPTDDLERVFRWHKAIGGLQATGGAHEDRARSAAEAIVDIEDYFDRLVAERRAAPTADLISELIAAQESGDRLSQAELISMCVTLLLAGHETSKNLISNGTLSLLNHPDQRAALLDDPSLLPSTVEECLRYESPIQRGWRRVPADTEIDGRQIKAGQLVYYMFGAANRDPAQFPDPDRFDVRRADNRHVAFGFGIHFCVGAPLARLEGAVALDTLFRRFPSLELRQETIEWGDSVHVRCPRNLVVGI